MAEQAASGRREWVLGALERYEIPLTRFALRLLGDEDAARDVVQHTLLRLCDQNPEELDGRLAQWLFTVCRNKAVDWLRARRKAAPLDEAALADRAGPDDDPAAVAERRDLHRKLSELIGQLPLSQREALTLWAEGLSSKEIASVLSLSEGNVRVLIHRALKALRQHPVARRLADEAQCEERAGIPSASEV